MDDRSTEKPHQDVAEPAGAGKSVKSAVVVREGVEADRDELREMAKLLWADNGIVDFEDDLLEEMLNKAFTRQGALFGVIGPVGGKIEGMVYLTISCFQWTRKPHLEEVMSYVRKEYRKPENIDALIAFSKRCVDGTDLPLIMGVFTNIRLAGKVKIYQRQFGYPSGAVFVYNGKFNSEVMGKEFWAPTTMRGARGKKNPVNGADRH